MSDATPTPDISKLAADVKSLEDQLAELKSHLKPPSDPPITIPPHRPDLERHPWSNVATGASVRILARRQRSDELERREPGDGPIRGDIDRAPTPQSREASRATHILSFEETSLREFDPLYYLARYPDLTAAFGTDKVAATRHYLTYGVHEGRSPSLFFDPVYYRDIHPDLRQHSQVQLLEHWYVYGVEEGRRGSPWFHIRYYTNAYPDLLRAFGNNYAAAFSHWKAYGHRERRQTIEGRHLQLYWGDVRNPNGTFSLVDNSKECLPEKPIQEEPSTGAILGLACKVLPHFGLQQACKAAIKKITGMSGGDYVICDEAGGREIRVREDPIFRGDINVPEEITRTA